MIKTYQGHGGEIFDADASHDNSRLVSGGADKIVFLTDVGTGQPIRKLRGHLSRINCVKFNEESSLILTGMQHAHGCFFTGSRGGGVSTSFMAWQQG